MSEMIFQFPISVKTSVYIEFEGEIPARGELKIMNVVLEALVAGLASTTAERKSQDTSPAPGVQPKPKPKASERRNEGTTVVYQDECPTHGLTEFSSHRKACRKCLSIKQRDVYEKSREARAKAKAVEA